MFVEGEGRSLDQVALESGVLALAVAEVLGVEVTVGSGVGYADNEWAQVLAILQLHIQAIRSR